MPKILRRIASIKFNASCRIHDMDYNTHKYNRLEADIRFFNNMIKQANGSWFWEVMAAVYFVLTRTAGRISWISTKKV